ncbi:MAG TPA: hypothetical protein ENI22_02220 [Candidatus Pacearchaeota archaeon]|nr:hypothetical protein [Candidatus Pacearchaeota archaeon]
MKTEIHIIDLGKITNLRGIRLEEGYVLKRKDGIEELVIELNYTESGKISMVDTLRRGEEGLIIESRYDIDTNTGELREFFAGMYHEENVPPYTESKKYFELNFILRAAEL